jgi:hypothetical protein
VKLRQSKKGTGQQLRGNSDLHPCFVKYWELIAENLKKRGWSLGWVSAIDSQGRTIWIVDAQRSDGRRFIVHADEKLSAFVELERQVLTVTFYLESIQADS